MYMQRNRGFIQIVVLAALALAFFVMAKGNLTPTPTENQTPQVPQKTFAEKIKEQQELNKDKPKTPKEPWLEKLDTLLAELSADIKKYGPTDMLQRLQSGAPSVIEEMAPQIGVSGASLNPLEDITPKVNGLLLNIIKH